MDVLLNAWKAQAGRMDMRVGQPRLGIVVSVRTQEPAARVKLQPGDVLTGWLPILTQWVGSGWGIVCPPSPGDQALVLAQEGYQSHGIIIGFCRSESSRPPTAAEGEFCLVHRSGSSLRLTNDGKVRIKGDLHVDGDVYDRTGSLKDFRTVYDGHHHRIFNGSLSDIPTEQI